MLEPKLIAPELLAPTAQALTAPTTAPLSVILDSNIWIDILVFDDAHSRPIKDALVSGALRATTNTACREELRRVLDYPQFKRYAIDQAAALAWADAHSTLHDVSEAELAAAQRLPTCKDLDDQKFLELARDCGARYLLSKDKLVLKMHSRMARLVGCEVLLPQKFAPLLAAHLSTLPSTVASTLPAA